jgi:hypothetical protein
MVTTGNGFSTAQAASPQGVGSLYVKRFKTTKNNQYLVLDQVGPFGGGQGGADRWLVMDIATKTIAGLLVPVNDAQLSNDAAIPLRQYYTGFDGSSHVTQWRSRELPNGTSDVLIASFSGSYNWIGTEGEGRQDDANGRIALLANRNNNSGADILVINVASGAIITTISLSGYYGEHGATLASATRNVDYLTISHDGLYVFLGVISGNAGGGFSGCTSAVAIFNATTGAYIRKTPDYRFSHGDAGVNSAGLQVWIGQDAAGSYAAKSIKCFGVDGTDAEMLAAGPTGSQSYVSGLIPGRALIGFSAQTTIDSSDTTAQGYCRVIDLKLDGSQYGSDRFHAMRDTGGGVYDAMLRMVESRDRIITYISAPNTDANRVDTYRSVYPCQDGNGVAITITSALVNADGQSIDIAGTYASSGPVSVLLRNQTTGVATSAVTATKSNGAWAVSIAPGPGDWKVEASITTGSTSATAPLAPMVRIITVVGIAIMPTSFPVTAISLSTPSGPLIAGQSIRLLVTDQQGFEVSNAVMTSNAHGIATVSSQSDIRGYATVTGVAEGVATISAAVGALIASGVVTVGQGQVAGIPIITTDTLPSGTVGVNYNQTLAAAGDAPITWSSSDLPPGFTLSSSGNLSAEPALLNGSFQITATATNALGADTAVLLLTVNSPVTTGSMWASKLQGR